MSSKWSGEYINVTEALEDPGARNDIKRGAITKLIEAGFGRDVGNGKIELSKAYLTMLENNREE